MLHMPKFHFKVIQHTWAVIMQHCSMMGKSEADDLFGGWKWDTLMEACVGVYKEEEVLMLENCWGFLESTDQLLLTGCLNRTPDFSAPSHRISFGDVLLVIYARVAAHRGVRNVTLCYDNWPHFYYICNLCCSMACYSIMSVGGAQLTPTNCSWDTIANHNP